MIRRTMMPIHILKTALALLLIGSSLSSSGADPAGTRERSRNCRCGAKKEFVVYDAMHYLRKPNLSADGLSPIRLIYEAFLLDEQYRVDSAEVRQQIQSAKQSGIRSVSLDIEQWYGPKSDEDLKADLKGLFDWFKRDIPNCNIGNYGLPVSNLNTARFYNKFVEPNPEARNKSEKELIASWKRSNAARMVAGEVPDVLYPSVYIVTPDVDQWLKDVKLTAGLIRKQYPGRKVIAYIWPQYYNFTQNPDYQKFIDPLLWTRMLEGCYKYFDGVVIWAHGRDVDNKTKVQWSDPRVQAMYAATKAFIAKHRITVEK